MADMNVEMCEWTHTVSDADFGYWNDEKWGEPSIQEFPCGEPAEVYVKPDSPWDERIALCITHSLEAATELASPPPMRYVPSPMSYIPTPQEV